MATLSVDETEQDEVTTTKTPKNRGFLSRAFASVATGFALGMTTRTCATALLCTAGAPAMTTAVTAMAVSGLALGTFHAYRDYRNEKKIFRDTKFLSKHTALNIVAHTAMSLAGGSLAMMFGDTVSGFASDAYEYTKETLGFAPDIHGTPPQPMMTEAPILSEAPELTTDESIKLPQLWETVETPQADTLIEPEITPEDESPMVVPEETEPALEKSDIDVVTTIESLEQPTLNFGSAIPSAIDLPAEAAAFNYTAQPVELPSVADSSMFHLPELGTPVEYTVSTGDTLWNIVEAHYGLTTNADIQQHVDAIAVFNGMEGVTANHIDIGDQIKLPEFGYVDIAKELQLDWHSLDADTLKMQLK